MGKVGDRGHAVHRMVEDQLRPLGRAHVGEHLRFEPGSNEELADDFGRRRRRSAWMERPEPGRRVQLVFDLVITVADPAHEGDRRDQRPVAVAGQQLLGADAVLDGHEHGVGEPFRERRHRCVHLRGLGRHDAQVEFGQGSRVGRGEHRGGEVRLARDREPVFVEGVRVLFPPHQHRHLGFTSQVHRAQAADHPGADDADPLQGHISFPRQRPSRETRRR